MFILNNYILRGIHLEKYKSSAIICHVEIGVHLLATC